MFISHEGWAAKISRRAITVRLLLAVVFLIGGILTSASFVIPQSSPTTQTDEPPPKSCGCGSGTGLALIPPLFYYSRRKFKNRAMR